jgi:hypothetical protein
MRCETRSVLVSRKFLVGGIAPRHDVETRALAMLNE